MTNHTNNSNMRDFKLSPRPSENRPRYLVPYQTGIAVASQTATAGRVLLHMIDVHSTCLVDAVIIVNGGTAAGNIVVGLYGPVPHGTDTCAGASVIAESASTAQSGTSTAQVITFPSPVNIKAGKYYIAVEYSDNTATYMRQSNGIQVVGWLQFYDRSGGYGALTNPCPTITETGSASVGCRLRVSI